MPLHVAPDAEGLAATGMSAFERLLACVAVAVYLQATRPGECLLANRTDVSVLHARKGTLGCGVHVLLWIPGVAVGEDSRW